MSPIINDPRLPARFWSKVQPDDNDCWVFTSSLTQGYGTFRFEGKTVKTHRLAYATFVGPIPDGLVLDHLCRNRACCNPAHLEAVTSRVNTLRGQTLAASYAERTHCQAGQHELIPENLFTTRLPSRVCRPCAAEANRSYRRSKRNHRLAA